MEENKSYDRADAGGKREVDPNAILSWYRSQIRNLLPLKTLSTFPVSWALSKKLLTLGAPHAYSSEQVSTSHMHTLPNECIPPAGRASLHTSLPCQTQQSHLTTDCSRNIHLQGTSLSVG